MAQWQEGTVTVNGDKFHYTRTGNGTKPAMLLLHGMTDNGRDWTRTAKALEDQFDIVMLDQRGHGQSIKPTKPYMADQLGEDAAGVIRELGLAPVVVMGHSMGGRAAMELAAHHPDLVSRLIIVDSGIRRPMVQQQTEEERRQWAEQRRQNMIEQQKLSQEDLERRCHEQHPAWSEEDCHHWAASKLEVSPDIMTLHQFGSNAQDLLPKITAPTLILYADPDRGGMVDEERAAEMVKLLPHGQAVHIAGAGHNIQREQYDAYLAAIKKFLNQTGQK